MVAKSLSYDAVKALEVLHKTTPIHGKATFKAARSQKLSRYVLFYDFSNCMSSLEVGHWPFTVPL